MDARLAGLGLELMLALGLVVLGLVLGLGLGLGLRLRLRVSNLRPQVGTDIDYGTLAVLCHAQTISLYIAQLFSTGEDRL